MKFIKLLSIQLTVGLSVLLVIELLIVFLLNNPNKIPSFLFPEFKQHYSLVDRNIIQFDSNSSRFDSSKFYVLKPGQFEFNNREFDTKYSVNSAGFRDGESDLNYPKIISIGDSYAMGWGVEQDSTYSEIIEGKTGISVLNTGISSYGTARELMTLKQLQIDSLKTLIIQYCRNDHAENKEFIRNNFSLPKRTEEYYNDIVFAQERTNSYYPLKHLVQFIKRKIGIETGNIETKEATLTQFNSKLDFVKFPEACFTAILDKILNYIPKSTKVLVIIPDDKKAKFYSRLITHLQKNDLAYERVEFIDLSDILKPSDFFILDEHCNNSGHKKIAQVLLQYF